MLFSGFIYGFKQNGNQFFVMPKELTQIYKEYNESEEKQDNELK